LFILFQEKSKNVSDELYRLLQIYNDLIGPLSETFVAWDQTLTKLEEKKKQEST